MFKPTIYYTAVGHFLNVRIFLSSTNPGPALYWNMVLSCILEWHCLIWTIWTVFRLVSRGCVYSCFLLWLNATMLQFSHAVVKDGATYNPSALSLNSSLSEHLTDYIVSTLQVIFSSKTLAIFASLTMHFHRSWQATLSDLWDPIPASTFLQGYIIKDGGMFWRTYKNL